MVSEGAIPESHNTAALWRDALIRFLIQAPDERHAPYGFLAAMDAASATVVSITTGETIVLLAWPEDDPAAVTLTRHRLKQILPTVRPGRLLHVVLIGGGPEGWALCREQQPFWQFERRVSLHQVEESGELHNAGPRLPALEDAVRSVVRGERLHPLTREEVLAARENLQRLAQAEQSLSGRLSKAATPGTIGLIVACAIIFGLEKLWSFQGELPLSRMGSIIPEVVIYNEQHWRLLSAIFLHGSLLHLAVNCWSLWALGRFVEKLLGTPRYLILYGLSGIVASMASVMMLPPRTESVGASGAIFGVMGGLLALTLRPGKVLPPTIATRLKRNLWPVLALNLIISLQPGIDKYAHLGGGLMGLVLVSTGALTLGMDRAPILGQTPLAGNEPTSSWWARAGAAIIVLAMAGAVLIAIEHGHPWVHPHVEY